MKMMMNDWDVRGGISDFWDYVRAPRPHRWAFWGVTFALTFAVFYGVAENIVRKEVPKPQIIYFENWAGNRGDAAVRTDWVARAKDVTRANAARRAEFQKLADMMGVDYDSTEADKVTRETLGAEADEIGKRPEPTRSTLAERAAHGPKVAAPGAPAGTDR